MRNKLKRFIIEEMLDILKEDVNYDFNFKGKKLKIRFDVNSNPTKKGIKIQFTNLTPGQDTKQLMSDLQVHLNQKLGAMGMSVDFDPDVPYQNVVGFTLKLEGIASTIIRALGGGTLSSDNQGKQPLKHPQQHQSLQTPNPNPFQNEKKPTT